MSISRFSAFLCLLGIYLLSSSLTSSCVMGDTGPCATDKDCKELYHNIIPLFCSRAWCVPGHIKEWAKREKPVSDASEERREPDARQICTECSLGEKRSCFPIGRLGCDTQDGTCNGVCKIGTQTCKRDDAQDCSTWGFCEHYVASEKETCDGLDNDCDGKTDEGLSCNLCHKGQKRSCYRYSKGCFKKGNSLHCTSPCKAGIEICEGSGKWGACNQSIGPTTETCNEKDDDCDGIIDQGCVVTFAGTPEKAGFQDHPVLPRQALFTSPFSLARFKQTLVVSDAGNNTIRTIDLARGAVATANGEYFTSPRGIFSFSDKGVYILDVGLHSIFFIDATTGVITKTIARSGMPGFQDASLTDTRFREPGGMAFIPTTKRFFIADTGNHVIRELLSDKVVTFAGKGEESGYLDAPSLLQARFHFPHSLAISNDERILYVADVGNRLIRSIHLESGNVSTLPGTFAHPSGLAVDHDGNLYVSDEKSHIIKKISTKNQVTLVAGKEGQPGYQDGHQKNVRFRKPKGLLFDKDGSLWIVDAGNHVIRKLILSKKHH